MSGEWVPISLFLSVAVIAVVFLVLRFRGKRELQKTVRLALEKNHELSPALLASLDERKRSPQADFRRGLIGVAIGASFALFALILVVGALTTIWSRPADWIRTKGPREAVRLRPGRGVHLWLPECRREALLRFEGAGGPHLVTVRGFDLDRELHIPSSGSVDVEVDVSPTKWIGSAGSQELRWVEVRLGEGQEPLEVLRTCK